MQRSLGERFIAVIVLVIFTFYSVLGSAYAQPINLPDPGSPVQISSSYTPVLLKGLTIDAERPFRFDAIVDAADSGLSGEALQAESSKLIRYFLTSLAMEEKDMWVNLSPYEKGRILPETFGKTEMGRDLLAQDYMLKRIAAVLMSPESEVGKKFWEKVYENTYASGMRHSASGEKQYPNADDQMLNAIDSFNKVWIVPDRGRIYQNGNSAFVAETHLKIMLESDYEASRRDAKSRSEANGISSDVTMNEERRSTNDIKELIKQIILPEIEREVNEGANFANLRQIYNSMLLAVWYKKALKESVLGQVFVNKENVRGMDSVGQQGIEAIYNRYVEAFKLGAEKLTEDYDPASGEIVARKYFSGGAVSFDPGQLNVTRQANNVPYFSDQTFRMSVDLAQLPGVPDPWHGYVERANLEELGLDPKPNQELSVVLPNTHQKIDLSLGAEWAGQFEVNGVTVSPRGATGKDGKDIRPGNKAMLTKVEDVLKKLRRRHLSDEKVLIRLRKAAKNEGLELIEVKPEKGYLLFRAPGQTEGGFEVIIKPRWARANSDGTFYDTSVLPTAGHSDAMLAVVKEYNLPRLVHNNIFGQILRKQGYVITREYNEEKKGYGVLMFTADFSDNQFSVDFGPDGNIQRDAKVRIVKEGINRVDVLIDFKEFQRLLSLDPEKMSMEEALNELALQVKQMTYQERFKNMIRASGAEYKHIVQRSTEDPLSDIMFYQEEKITPKNWFVFVSWDGSQWDYSFNTDNGNAAMMAKIHSDSLIMPGQEAVNGGIDLKDAAESLSVSSQSELVFPRMKDLLGIKFDISVVSPQIGQPAALSRPELDRLLGVAQ